MVSGLSSTQTRQWTSDERFLEAWKDLKENVFSELGAASGLSWYVSIFCIYHLDDGCVGCGYGKNHGFCMSENSDWRKITHYIPSQKPFTNKFYRDLLNKVMEEKT